MNKIDRRRNYYCVLDVETANTIGQPLVYDIGYAIMDKQGRIYKKGSYVVQEIFFDEKKIYKNPRMMGTAYYKQKLPQYYEGIFETGAWDCKPLRYIQKVIENACADYEVKAVCAYNASFDTKALRNTIRYVTKSDSQEFLPDVEIFDIWVMACQTICQQAKFYKFCFDNGLYSDARNCKTSAETVYSFLSGNAEFEEAHTGLEDVLIEAAIMAKCLKYSIPNKGIIPMPWKIPQAEWHRRYDERF